MAFSDCHIFPLLPVPLDNTLDSKECLLFERLPIFVTAVFDTLLRVLCYDSAGLNLDRMLQTERNSGVKQNCEVDDSVSLSANTQI